MDRPENSYPIPWLFKIIPYPGLPLKCRLSSHINLRVSETLQIKDGGPRSHVHDL